MKITLRMPTSTIHPDRRMGKFGGAGGYREQVATFIFRRLGCDHEVVVENADEDTRGFTIENCTHRQLLHAQALCERAIKVASQPPTTPPLDRIKCVACDQWRTADEAEQVRRATRVLYAYEAATGGTECNLRDRVSAMVKALSE